MPLDQRVAAMRDPEVRAKILSDDPQEFNTWSLLNRVSYKRMFHFSNPLNYTPSKEQFDHRDRRARGPHRAGSRL